MRSGAKKKKVTPLAGGVRPPITMVDALIEKTQHQRTRVAHEEFGGMKIIAEEPEADPERQRGDQRPHVRHRQKSQALQAQPVDAERSRGDGHDAGREAVEPVDQVDGVAERKHPQRRDQRQDRGPEDDEAGEGQLELVHRGALKSRGWRPRGTAPPTFAGALISRKSSTTPTTKITPAASRTPSISCDDVNHACAAGG